MNSLKTKITAIVICCIILSSAAIGGASIVNSRRAVAEDSANIMSLMCDNRAQEINAIFLRTEQTVKTLAEYAQSQLTDVDRLRTDATYVEECTRALLNVSVNAAQSTDNTRAVYIRLNPDIAGPTAGFFYGKSSGDRIFRELTATDLSAYDSSEEGYVAWYYEAVNAGRGTWIAPYYNENIKTEIVSYVIPIYFEEQLIGVVGMDFDFQVLKQIIDQTSVYSSGYTFLADDNAKIVYHKELARDTDLVKYNKGEFKDMAKILKGEESSGADLLSYSYEGEKKEAVFRKLENDMRLVLTAPVKEIHKQANQLIGQIALTVVVIIILATALTVVFTTRLVQPLLELTSAARKIADGDLSVSIKHHSHDEVGTLAESFRQTVSYLHKYITYINELAYRDSLTGVQNKTAYMRAVDRVEELTRKKEYQYAVIIFDINGLKEVNDTLGHDSGDHLIADSCSIMTRVFVHSPVYRIGGDEFAVILEKDDYNDRKELLKQFQMEIDIYNHSLYNSFTVSIARGMAEYSSDTDVLYNDVFRRADSAMYHDKVKTKAITSDKE